MDVFDAINVVKKIKVKDAPSAKDFVRAFNDVNKAKNTKIVFSRWDNLLTNSDKGIATFKAEEDVWASHEPRSNRELENIWKSGLRSYISDISINSVRRSTYEITIRGCKFDLLSR